MTLPPIRSALILLLPIAISVGCGGGSGTSAVPVTAAALEQPATQTNTEEGGNNTPEATPAPPVASVTQTISGRVADGYIQGALVCLDTNENGACDDGEPTATSGEGGTYALDIPAADTDKPIIANVPVTAIDEDTGEAIGKKLTLSTPAGRPEFISPITTLVHEALKDDPNLTIDEAEGAVKEELGLGADKRAGLFDDYVANQRGDDASVEDYQFLHQTARVIATMMDDIQAQVEQAANESGVDFAADEETRKAMRQLVRREVRELLPDISVAVAEEIRQRGADDTRSQENAAPLLIDADKLADRLERRESDIDLIEKIDAIRDTSDVSRVPVKDLLTQGMYWLEVECHSEEFHEAEALDHVPEKPVQVILDDDGTPSPVALPTDCYAEYGHITIDGNNELLETTFEYDNFTGSWEEQPRDAADEPVFGFYLKDGEWVALTDSGPEGEVEFLDDGSAVLTSGNGKMLVYATTRALDNTPVLHHLFRLGGDTGFAALKDDEARFPEGAAVHHLNVKRKSQTHVLFNWTPQDDPVGCEQFNGNCNVVDVMDDAGFAPAGSLDAIREQSLSGVSLGAIVHHHEAGQAIDLKLQANTDSLDDDGLPTSGTATWLATPVDHGDVYPEPMPAACVPDELFDEQQGEVPLPRCSEVDVLPLCETFAPLDEPELMPLDTDFDSTATTRLPDTGKDLIVEPVCIEVPAIDALNTDTGTDGLETKTGDITGQPLVDAPNDGAVRSTPDAGTAEHFGNSAWKVVTVDGVSMIEVDLPVAISHVTDAEDFAALLLIDAQGYVRRGARMHSEQAENAVMYSEAAFATLQTIAESYVTP